MRIIDKLARKFGYISYGELNKRINVISTEQNKKYNELEKANIDRLIDAIKYVNMIKVKTKFNNQFMYFKGGDLPDSVEVEYEYSPESNWYGFQVRIDVGKLQRIYQDFEMFSNSPEYDYLITSSLCAIERDIAALMKLHGAIK